jgi:hypothetical protein
VRRYTFANGNVDLDNPAPGTEEVFEIPVTLPPDSALPASFVFVLAVYIEGGSFYIPTPGIDHNALYPITINDSTTPIIIDDVLYVVPVEEGI